MAVQTGRKSSRAPPGIASPLAGQALTGGLGGSPRSGRSRLPRPPYPARTRPAIKAMPVGNIIK